MQSTFAFAPLKVKFLLQHGDLPARFCSCCCTMHLSFCSSGPFRQAASFPSSFLHSPALWRWCIWWPKPPCSACGTVERAVYSLMMTAGGIHQVPVGCQVFCQALSRHHLFNLHDNPAELGLLFLSLQMMRVRLRGGYPSKAMWLISDRAYCQAYAIGLPGFHVEL